MFYSKDSNKHIGLNLENALDTYSLSTVSSVRWWAYVAHDMERLTACKP